MTLKQKLDAQYLLRNTATEITYQKPDPLLVARKYNDEYIALVCALFAYGKASLIVNFLNSIDFDIINKSDTQIEKYFESYYYRFQKSQDIISLFKKIKQLRDKYTLENIVLQGYQKNKNILDGISSLIKSLIIDDYTTQGYNFLIGQVPPAYKTNRVSPYKRINMFFRWMIRDDNIDLGLWKNIDKKDLILPLDTHTHKVSLNLGLITRKQYDLESALLITQKLREFDKDDPIKYDFALYRLGQEKLL